MPGFTRVLQTTRFGANNIIMMSKIDNYNTQRQE